LRLSARGIPRIAKMTEAGQKIMVSKRLLVLLTLANVALVVTCLYLLTTADPSNLVRFVRTYGGGSILLWLLCNVLLYRRLAA
jgi:hypothetical protein